MIEYIFLAREPLANHNEGKARLIRNRRGPESVIALNKGSIALRWSSVSLSYFLILFCFVFTAIIVLSLSFHLSNIMKE